MPLLRIAHPSEEDCQKELDRLKSNLKSQTPTKDDLELMENNISNKGVRIN